MAKRESGFTLVEALIAIVVLVFGLIAIAQLFVVASQSNVTARKATAAADTSSEVIERLMALPFDSLKQGGSVLDPAMELTDSTPTDFAVENYQIVQDVPGVGRVLTCWQIGGVATDLVAIHVRSQVVGLLSGLSKAEFTTFRARVVPPSPSPTPGS
jgi:type II secretory pathway component PulJ